MPGAEIFTTTLAFAKPLDAPFTQENVSGLAAQLAPLYGAFHAKPAAFASGGVVFQRVDTYAIGVDGRATAQGSGTLVSPVQGSGGLNLPNQCTMVMSLRTGRPGRAFRGRMYLPTLSMGIYLESDGQIAPGQATDLATAFRIFLEGANDITFGPEQIRAVVASGVGEGANTEITQLSVGRVIDTQRRRRNELAEDPITLPIAP
jgi:hypothetical protein